MSSHLLARLVRRRLLFLLSQLLLISALGANLWFFTSEKLSREAFISSKLTFANELKARGLFGDVAEIYEELLSLDDSLKKLKRANVHFLLANLYQEEIHNYNKAIHHYLWVDHLLPNTKISDQANLAIIDCLEKIEDEVEAQNALDENVSMHASLIDEKLITINGVSYNVGDVSRRSKKAIVDLTEKDVTRFLKDQLLVLKAEQSMIDRESKFVRDFNEIRSEMLISKLFTAKYADTMGVSVEPTLQLLDEYDKKWNKVRVASRLHEYLLLSEHFRSLCDHPSASIYASLADELNLRLNWNVLGMLKLDSGQIERPFVRKK